MPRGFLLYFILSLQLLLYYSCAKDRSCEGCRQNKPPVAVAGPDRIISLPTDSVALDASASHDPDGTITGWSWKKISGPASIQFVNPTNEKTIAKHLVTGKYLIELKVTDNGGLSATDTMMIILDVTGVSNHPPVANAGPDQTITVPAGPVNLDGSASSDPDYNITSYLWTKISGPASFNIANANTVHAQATNLVEGTYQFELKVTDTGGLFSKDTMKVSVISSSPFSCASITRPAVPVQLIPFGNLSIARSGIATAAGDNKLFFAGGYNASGPSSRVDIYDFATSDWTTAELSIPRSEIATATVGDKILFAGGYKNSFQFVTRVDIYNLTTQTWSTTELSLARGHMAVTVQGNKVFFAGGFDSVFMNGPGTGPGAVSRVDIYNAATNVWSTATLSIARGGAAAVATENKVLIAGGYDGNNNGSPSTRIDIYDIATGSWSTSSLLVDRAFCSGIYDGGWIFWSGGLTGDVNLTANESPTCTVEIQTSNGQPVAMNQLYDGRAYIGAYKKGNKIIWIRSGNMYMQTCDIYDTSTGLWFVTTLNDPALYKFPGVLAAYDKIYMAGGWQNASQFIYTSQVWRVEL